MFGSTNLSASDEDPCADPESYVRGGPTLQLWQRFFFSFFLGERIQISLKSGHHRPASETPFKWRFAGCRRWPNVECWLGSFENLRGSGPVLLRYSIFLWLTGKGGPDPLTRMRPANVYTENPSYRAHRLLYDTAYFQQNAQIFKLAKHSFLSSSRVWSGSKPFFCKCK